MICVTVSSVCMTNVKNIALSVMDQHIVNILNVKHIVKSVKVVLSVNIITIKDIVKNVRGQDYANI